METLTTSLKRPLTDLMPQDLLYIILYLSCLTFHPGSALVNLILIGTWQWRSSPRKMARLLPGIYMNQDEQPDFKGLLKQYKKLKAAKKQGWLSIEQKREFAALKGAIAELSPKPRYTIYKYRPDIILITTVVCYSVYRLYTLFPDTMRLLFGEGIWQHLK